MDILEIEDVLKGLPDQALRQEAQQPSGQVPQYMVVSEIQRRSKMRKSFEAQKQQPSGTVREQILQEGIASVAPPPAQMMGAMGMPKILRDLEIPEMVVTPTRAYDIDRTGARIPIPTEQERADVAAGMPPGDTGLPISEYQYAMQQEAARRDREAYEKEMMQRANPQAMPPQQMASGGVVKMAGGEKVPYRSTGSTISETAESLYSQPGVGSVSSNIDDLLAKELSRFMPTEPAQKPNKTIAPYRAGTILGIPIDIKDDPRYAKDLDVAQQSYSGVNVGDLSDEELADLVSVNPAQASGAGVNIGDLPVESLPLTASDMADVVTDVNNSGAVVADTKKVATGNTELTPEVILSGLSEKSFVDKYVEDRMKDITGSNYDRFINKANNLIGDVPVAQEDSETLNMFSTMPTSQDVARVNVARPELGDLIAPNYSKIIEAQEQRLKKIREDAKRDVGAQALIQLGAGIAAGDVSTGLSEAGKAAAEERKRQRDAEDQITSLQTQIQMAQEQGKFDVAKALRDEQLNLYKMDVDLEKDYLSRSREAYEYDAALQKGIIEFNNEFGQSVAEFNAELDQAVDEYNLKVDEMGLEAGEEEGLRLRATAKAQQDILLRVLADDMASDEEKQAAVDALKQTIQQLKEPYSVTLPPKKPNRQTGSVPDTSGMTISRG